MTACLFLFVCGFRGCATILFVFVVFSFSWLPFLFLLFCGFRGYATGLFVAVVFSFLRARAFDVFAIGSPNVIEKYSFGLQKTFPGHQKGCQNEHKSDQN